MSYSNSILIKQLHLIFQTLQNCKQTSKDDRLFVRRYLVQNLRQQCKANQKKAYGIAQANKKLRAWEIQIQGKNVNCSHQFRRLIQILLNKDLVVVQMQLRKVIKAIKEKQQRCLFVGRPNKNYNSLQKKIQLNKNNQKNNKEKRQKINKIILKDAFNQNKSSFQNSKYEINRQLSNQKFYRKCSTPSIIYDERNIFQSDFMTPRHKIDLKRVYKNQKSQLVSKERPNSNSIDKRQFFKNKNGSQKKILSIKLTKQGFKQALLSKAQEKKRLSFNYIHTNKQNIFQQQNSVHQIKLTETNSQHLKSGFTKYKYYSNQPKTQNRLLISNPLSFTDISLYKSKLEMIQNRDFIRTSENTKQIQKVKCCLKRIFAEDLYCFIMQKYNQNKISLQKQEIQDEILKSETQHFKRELKLSYTDFLKYLRQFVRQVQQEDFQFNEDYAIIPPFQSKDQLITEENLIKFIQLNCLQSANKIRAYFVQLDVKSLKVISIQQFQRLYGWKSMEIKQSFKKLVQFAGNEKGVNYWQMYKSKETNAFKQFEHLYFK